MGEGSLQEDERLLPKKIKGGSAYTLCSDQWKQTLTFPLKRVDTGPDLHYGVKAASETADFRLSLVEDVRRTLLIKIVRAHPHSAGRSRMARHVALPGTQKEGGICLLTQIHNLSSDHTFNRSSVVINYLTKKLLITWFLKEMSLHKFFLQDIGFKIMFNNLGQVREQIAHSKC